MGFLAVALLLTGCGSSHKPAAGASTTSSSSESAPTSPPTTLGPTVGEEAFTAYKSAFSVIAAIAGSPTGISTDPRLAQVLMNPWYLQVVQEINVYRLRDEVVKGTYSFSNFQLDSVTPDGRVIFTDCQTNSQAVYNARTGALIGNAGTSRIPEQVVAYRSSPTAPFKIADDNQGTETAGARNACAS